MTSSRIGAQIVSRRILAHGRDLRSAFRVGERVVAEVQGEFHDGGLFPDRAARSIDAFQAPSWHMVRAAGSRVHGSLLPARTYSSDPTLRILKPPEDTTMKLGLAIGYSGAHLEVPVALVQRAEELGYDSVWSAEAYGSDAITPLAFLAAKTNRIKLGTGIMQLAARTPANAAMSAASIDAMAGGGRFIAGLGVSGPQIVEGWYGQPWGKPYYRVKDYVAIMRKIFKREGPVTHEGREISLPYKGEGSAGLAKPLKSILHMNPDIPIYLATGSEAMVKLTAEIADGCLPMGFVPGAMEEYGPWLEEGFRRAGNGKSFKDFTIQASVHVEVDNDVKGALTRLKPEVALYVGGMGHRTKNFHNDIMVRRGFGDAAMRIQELYLAGHKDEAIATVPDEWVDLKSLVGPPARIRERYRAWEDSGAHSLSVRSRQPEAIEVMAKAAQPN
jgi:F420-dependent oxidoreductase-like protein